MLPMCPDLSLRTWCLAAVLVGLGALTRPGAALAQYPYTAYCIYSETPPAPPAKGAVLWTPPTPGSTDPNTVVIPFNGPWLYFNPGCAPATVENPRVISVAPGGALI